MKKHGRFGPFVACSNYPKCTYIHRETADVPCPKCGKALAKRFTKRRKVFYGCVGYPKCDFVTWDKPIAGPLPQVQSAHPGGAFQGRRHLPRLRRQGLRLDRVGALSDRKTKKKAAPRAAFFSLNSWLTS